MGPPFIALGFGLVVIAAMFVSVVFYRAWRFPLIEVDDRYNTVIVALITGTVGVALWALNPLLQALGGGPLNGWLLFAASLLVMASLSTLIFSTAMGATKTILRLYMAAASAWVAGVLAWWYL